MAAKLTICDPGFALRRKIKRERIDENRLSTQKLNVVCTRVLEDHAVIQRFSMHAQGCQRGILEHGERPLVGIGDHRNTLRTDHAKGILRQRRLLCLFVRNQAAGLCKCIIKTALHESIILRAVALVYLAVENALAPEHRPARIAKRAELRLGISHASAPQRFLPHRLPRSGPARSIRLYSSFSTRQICGFAKTRTPRQPLPKPQ